MVIKTIKTMSCGFDMLSIISKCLENSIIVMFPYKVKGTYIVCHTPMKIYFITGKFYYDVHCTTYIVYLSIYSN